MSSFKSPTFIHALLLQVLKACQGSWPANLSSITVDGASYTQGELVQKLAVAVAPYDAVVEDRTAYKNSLTARRDAHPTTHAFILNLSDALRVFLGADNEELNTFGTKPKKVRAKPSAEKAALAAAKRRATRAARHTLGKKQKAVIHGTVPAVQPGANGAASGEPNK